MEVYIANGTLQHRQFHYRIPGVDTPRVLRIGAGQQAKLHDDLSGSQLESVLKQLQRAGAVESPDVRLILRPKALVYSVSKTVKVDDISEAMVKDEEARQNVASEKMEEAGFNAFQIAQQGGKKVVETSVEIVAVNDNGRIKDDVNAEIIVSKKPSRRAGRKRVEDKD